LPTLVPAARLERGTAGWLLQEPFLRCLCIAGVCIVAGRFELLRLQEVWLVQAVSAPRPDHDDKEVFECWIRFGQIKKRVSAGTAVVVNLLTE
jgi:hypothetical protein